MCNKKSEDKSDQNSVGENRLNEQEFMEISGGTWPILKQNNKGSFEKTRIIEKCVYVITTLFIIALSHAIIWYQGAIPVFYVIGAPVVLFIKTFIYWRSKWHYFMVDFCYFANILTMVYIWFPENPDLFRTVFGVTNGPLLIAAVLWRNSLVFHHHDKITSCFIHLVPAFVTFCMRWFPRESSAHWYKTMILEPPEFDALWLYVMPFAFFFVHSVIYFLIVNLIVRPKDPYLNSYDYLAVKFAHLNISKGPMGQMALFYGLNYLFCLCSLPAAMLAYWSFPAHCAILLLVFCKVAWNGGSYYMHVFSERGFAADAE